MNVQGVEAIVDEYVAGYVMESDDGYHLPTEAEKVLIKDVVMGLLAEPDFIAAFVSEAKACHELAQDAAIARDAARYRILRDPQNWTQDFLVVNESETRFTHGDALDAAIDALLADKEPKL